jgi:hypothetical protein
MMRHGRLGGLLAAAGVLAGTCAAIAAAAPPAAPPAVQLVSPGGRGTDLVWIAGISADSRHVYLQSRDRLTADDADDSEDVFDRSAGRTSLVSSPRADGIGTSFAGSSADGSRAFVLTTDGIAATDRDGAADIYERSSGGLSLVTPGSRHVHAYPVAVAEDGRRVVFRTAEALLPQDRDGNATDLYAVDHGKLRLLSGGSDDHAGVLVGDASPDARTIIFTTNASLTADDNDGGRRDVYRTVDGQVSLVSRTGSAPVGASYRGVSDSGSRIAFATRAALLPADQDNGRSDVYLAEGSKLSLVTGRDTASYAGMTPDGKTVFFTTRQALAPEDRDGGALDIYAWSSGGTRLVSGGTGAQDATFGAASADGKRVFFTTGESLTPTDADGGQQDVYVSAAGTLRLVSSGGNGARDAYFGGLTPKGTAVFMSRDSLTAGDRDGRLVDVYAATADGTVTLLTPGSPFSDALFRRLAPDGRTVYFETPEGLDPRDLDGKVDVYSAAMPGG